MRPEFLHAAALAAAEARSLDQVLQRVVDGLAGDPQVALARLWLMGIGDLCDACPMRAECPDQTLCLHLAASAGPAHDERFGRVPLNVGEVGRIAASGEPLRLAHLAEGSFAGQPLVLRGEVMGVVAVWSRADLGEAELAALRALADHAALAIANARAFEELAALRRRLAGERDTLREELRAARGFGEIIGRSPALRTVLEQIELVGPTDAAVLIRGESGTGKALIATAIHERSVRRSNALVRIDCASLPRERLEVADGGTLFLDEVGEIPLELQGKLVRVLEEGRLACAGEEHTRPVDVRVVAATRRDLRQEVAAGRFREDLYYRLAVFPIELPPLRARREDIGPLAAHFVAQAAARLRRPELRLTAGDVRALERYAWPGNVRELANALERAALLARGARLPIEAVLPAAGPARRPAEPAEEEIETEAQVRARERANLLAALAHCGGKVHGPGGAAELLGVKATTLASRIRAMGIERP